MPLFDTLPLLQFSKSNHFIWPQLIFSQKPFYFCIPPLKTPQLVLPYMFIILIWPILEARFENLQFFLFVSWAMEFQENLLLRFSDLISALSDHFLPFTASFRSNFFTTLPLRVTFSHLYPFPGIQNKVKFFKLKRQTSLWTRVGFWLGGKYYTYT